MEETEPTTDYRQMVNDAVREHLEHETPLEQVREYGPPEAVDKLMASVAQARQNFGPIKKSKQGRSGNQTYMYAPFSELLAATVLPLANHGVTVWQPLSGPTAAGKLRVTTWVRGHGAKVESVLEFEPAGSIKDVGAQITYYRRYAYNAALLLDADGDADDGDFKSIPDRKGPPSMPDKPPQRSRPQQAQKPPQRPPQRPPSEPPTRAPTPSGVNGSRPSGYQAPSGPAQRLPPTPEAQQPPPKADPRQATIPGAELDDSPQPDNGDRPTSKLPEEPDTDAIDGMFNALLTKVEALGWAETRIAMWVAETIGKTLDDQTITVAEAKQLIDSADSHLRKMTAPSEAFNE